MRCSRGRAHAPVKIRAKRHGGPFVARFLLSMLPALALTSSLFGQEVGSREREFNGHGVVIRVIVHDPSGEALSSPAVVKLFLGQVPSGQQNTSSGVAEFIELSLGEYSVVVAAPGYPEAQKDAKIDTTGHAQVDVYLRLTSGGGNPSIVPGRMVLAPKAKEVLDKGLRALRENKLAEAEKYLGEAMRLAPGNPEVLYAQGMLRLKQRDWGHAQTVLEKATQIDPNSAQAFAALGWALCDQGKYDAAIAPLKKSLELNPSGGWETRWALAKSYYQSEQYPAALTMSQEALARSNGSAPAIALLVAQSLTAVGRYEDAAEVLREFLRDHANQEEAATARRWLEQLTASAKIRTN